MYKPLLRASLRVSSFLITLMLLACRNQLTATPTMFPIAPSPTPSPQQPDTPSPTEQLESGLAPNGPWLVFAARPESEADPNDETNFTLWAANPDGTGVTQLSDEKLFLGFEGPPRSIVSPDGRWLATITSSDGYHDLTLQLLSATDLTLQPITPLTSPETEVPKDRISAYENNDPSFTILRALGVGVPVWSPDSRLLAFASAHESDSTDPYLYDVETGISEHLATQPQQVDGMLWSPDQKILIVAETEGLGYSVPDLTATPEEEAQPGVWAVNVDGSGERYLYEGPYVYGEIFLGWTQPDTFAVYRSIPNSGPANIRIVNIQTGAVQVLTANDLSGMDLDPASGTVLYSEPGGHDFINNVDFEAGIYLLKPGASKPERIASNTDDFSIPLRWIPERNVFAVKVSGGNTVAITPDGKMSPLNAPNSWEDVQVSHDGESVAWFRYLDGIIGLSIGEFNHQTTVVTTKYARVGTWSPDNTAFYFVTDDGLLRATAPTFEPARIAPDLQVYRWSPMVWFGGADQ